MNGSKPQYDNIIWDFNGTLIDDALLSVRSVNELLARRGLPTLTLEMYRRVFGFPIQDYYRRIGMDMDAETPARLADEFHEQYMAGLPDVRLQPGCEALLAWFAERGCRQFVLSAMDEELLVPAIERLGIAHRFTAVYGLDNRFAHSKIGRGESLMDDHLLRGQRSLMIGDTDHDAEVAEALGFEIILVASGHQDVEQLCECDLPVCTDLSDLLTTLRGRS